MNLGKIRENMRRNREDPPEWKRELLRQIDALARMPGAAEVFKEHIQAVADALVSDKKAKDALPGLAEGESMSYADHEAKYSVRDLLGPGPPLTLAEKVFILAAFHDVLCKAERMPPIMEWDLAPELAKDPRFAAFCMYRHYADECADLPDEKLRPSVLRRYVEEVKAELPSPAKLAGASAVQAGSARIMTMSASDYAGYAKVLLEIQAKCREWGQVLRKNGWDDSKDHTHARAAQTPDARVAELAVMGLIKRHEKVLTDCRNSFIADPSTSLDRAFDYIGKYINSGPGMPRGVPEYRAEHLAVEVRQPSIEEGCREPTFIVQLGRWAEKLGEKAAAEASEGPRVVFANKPKKKRGPKPSRDHTFDRKVYEARQQGLDYKALARQFYGKETKTREVALAIDAHRKRLRRGGT